MEPGNFLYEYAVIRVVPRVEREEFINAGVILYCAQKKFLQCKYRLNDERFVVFCDTNCLDEVKEHLIAFEMICSGSSDSGPIGKLPPAERFRWLTATRSTILQTSKVHPGLCDDPATMLEHLFKQLVL
jgi:hypothetical protein